MSDGTMREYGAGANDSLAQFNQSEPSPELKRAIRKVQKGVAKNYRERAIRSIRASLERNEDVADVYRERGGLTVAMMTGVTLRVEVL